MRALHLFELVLALRFAAAVFWHPPPACNRSSSLTYPAPRFFPFPSFRVALETAPGACDLAARKEVRASACEAFSRGKLAEPEPYVVEAIASVLVPACMTGPCRAVDVGGNLGVHAAYMASLGARTEVVEPAIDLVNAIQATVTANCWDHRVIVHRAGITAEPEKDGSVVPFEGGWRMDRPAPWTAAGKEVVLKHDMRLLSLDKLLLRGRVDFLKIDIDSPRLEQQLLSRIAELVTRPARVDLGAIVLELGLSKQHIPSLARSLASLQASGYHVYRLVHGVHSMDELEPWYTPCIGIRSIRYMLHVANGSKTGQGEQDAEHVRMWREVLAAKKDIQLAQASWGYSTTFLLSREALTVPVQTSGALGDYTMRNSLPPVWRTAHCGSL